MLGSNEKTCRAWSWHVASKYSFCNILENLQDLFWSIRTDRLLNFRGALWTLDWTNKFDLEESVEYAEKHQTNARHLALVMFVRNPLTFDFRFENKCSTWIPNSPPAQLLFGTPYFREVIGGDCISANFCDQILGEYLLTRSIRLTTLWTSSK